MKQKCVQKKLEQTNIPKCRFLSDMSPSPSPPQGSSAYFIFRGLHPKEDNLSAQDAYLPREELGMRFDHTLTRKCGATDGRCSRHYWKKKHTHTHTQHGSPFPFLSLFLSRNKSQDCNHV